MSNVLQGVLAELTALDAQSSKVVGELTPVRESFTITALKGVFADDVGIAVGDRCDAIVLRGRVGQMGTDGMWGQIAPGTIVEYAVTHAGVKSVPAIEAFYAG